MTKYVIRHWTGDIAGTFKDKGEAEAILEYLNYLREPEEFFTLEEVEYGE